MTNVVQDCLGGSDCHLDLVHTGVSSSRELLNFQIISLASAITLEKGSKREFHSVSRCDCLLCVWTRTRVRHEREEPSWVIRKQVTGTVHGPNLGDYHTYHSEIPLAETSDLLVVELSLP